LKEKLIDGSVEYRGFFNDIRHIISQSSIFVLPSYYREGVPRSIQEAMSMGRPIITTDWIGCKETVIDGYNGFLVKPKDSEDLAVKMSKFLVDSSLVSMMGANSHSYCMEKFDVNVINKQMIEFLDMQVVDRDMSVELAKQNSQISHIFSEKYS
jgi:glycosyltransferase involved in cell wall biosynthesis